MAGVEKAEVLTAAEVMNNDVREERRASLQRRLHEAESSMVKEGYEKEKSLLFNSQGLVEEKGKGSKK